MAGRVAPAFKDFDAEARKGVAGRGPSCTFKLAGKTWSVRSRDDVPFSMIQRLIAAAGNPQETAIEVGPFFEAVIVPAQVEAFMVMLRAPDSKVTLAILTPIITFVFGSLTGRPTVPPVRSSTGRSTTRAKSAGGSSSRATTRRASTG